MNAALNMNSSVNMNEKTVLSALNAASFPLQMLMIMDWLMYVKDASDEAINATIRRIVKEKCADRYLAVVAKVIMKNERLHAMFVARFNDPIYTTPINNEPTLKLVEPTIEYVDRSTTTVPYEPTPTNDREIQLAVDAAALDGWVA